MLTMLKVLIVDDENKSRESLKMIIEEFCANVEVVGLASSVKEALTEVELKNPDVVFLDIRMNKETGFDFLSKCKKINFEVVFTTAYSEYAIDAIKFSALDYLLKPINVNQLKEAVAKAEKRIAQDTFKDKFEYLLQNFKVDSSENYKLVLPTIEGLIFLSFKDVIYCEASSNYTCFHLKDGKKFTVSKTLKEYDELLTSYNFFRIHHSYLINLREIKKYVKGEGGYVVMSNDCTLEVSKRKKELFINMISGPRII